MSYFENTIVKEVKEIEKKVLKMFFGNDVIEYRQGFDGQKCENNKYIIGAKTGPLTSIDGLYHEMSHFAEREIEHLKKYPANAWGFYFGKPIYVPGITGLGGVYRELDNNKDVMREARVWAYQINLAKVFGGDLDIVDIVSSARFLHGWCYYAPGSNPKEKTDKLAAEVEMLSRNEFTFESFCDNWKQRIEILGNVCGNSPLIISNCSVKD